MLAIKFAHEDGMYDDVDTAELDKVALEEQVHTGLEVIYALEELDAIDNDAYTSLESMLLQVATEGIAISDIELINSIAPGTFNDVDILHYTRDRSTTGLTVAVEAVNWKMAGIIAIIVAAVAGLITALVKWILAKLGGMANAKMADRIAAVTDRIYERTDLADLSEAYSVNNPWKAGSREALLYQSLLIIATPRNLTANPEIEIILNAVVEYQTKVKPKNFPDAVAIKNAAYLVDAFMCIGSINIPDSLKEYGVSRKSDSKIRERAVGAIVGNFLANVHYNAYEHYIITTPPENSLFSEQGVATVLAQYKYFFLIAESYVELMNNFTLAMINTLGDIHITPAKFNSNPKGYSQIIGQFFGRMDKMPEREAYAAKNQAYTKLENMLFDYWIEFESKYEIQELKVIIDNATTSGLWLFDTNQLYGKSIPKKPSKPSKFTDSITGGLDEKEMVTFVNPSPSGMRVDHTIHIYAVLNRLSSDLAKGTAYHGAVFNFGDFFSEHGERYMASTGMANGMPLLELHKYGLVDEGSVTLSQGVDAIKNINKTFSDEQYAKRLENVSDSMQFASAQFEEWKTSFNGSFTNFINNTGTYDDTVPPGKMGHSAMKRGNINIDVTMRAIFNSINETAKVLARQTKCLQGMDRHILTAIDKRSKAAKAWKSVSPDILFKTLE